MVVFVGGVLFLLSPSCQKYEDNLLTDELLKSADMALSEELCRSISDDNKAIYFGHRIFKRGHGAPSAEIVTIENPDYNCYDGNFVLKIRNGMDKRTRVSSAEIRIDGVLIAGPWDFSKNVYLISKHISGLKPESILEVRINSTPGSYIDLWIEGVINKLTPTFDKIGPLCQNSVAPELSLSSNNTPPVTGTWSPAAINTATAGIRSYIFTPDGGQCANPITMDIEVVNSTVPIFTQIGPLAQGATAPDLPSISENGISGTWVPQSINTSVLGTHTFTFTPATGQCATSVNMDIDVTSSETTVTDIDGNVYKTVKIGDQMWMAENLKVTRYRNGESIGTTSPASMDISGESTPKYQWAYNGDESNAAIYGRLYTWYAVADSRGVCPAGWHVPSDTEWTALTDYLINNGYGYEGSGSDIAKSLAAKTGWRTDATPGNTGNDQGSNNSTGFNSVPGGYRINTGTFTSIGGYASWWSSTESSTSSVWFKYLLFNGNDLRRNASYKFQGGAVRCIKD